MKFTIMVIFICFFMVQCSKDEDDGTHVAPKIEWIPSTTTTTYTYSGEVVSGYYFYTNFKVLNNSGEICIDASNEGANGTNCNTIIYVEEGKQYNVQVKGTRVGGTIAFKEDTCLSIVFCSINCMENYIIPVGSYFVPGDGVITEDGYNCANRINLSDIVLAEVK